MTPDPRAFLLLRRIYVQRQLFDLRSDIGNRKPTERESSELHWWESEEKILLAREAELEEVLSDWPDAPNAES
jgi:hypothetical protein